MAEKFQLPRGRTFKYSLGKRMLERYLLLIFLPLLLVSIIFVASFYYISRNYFLYQHKTYMESAHKTLLVPYEQVEVIKTALSGRNEFNYFLTENYYSRPELLYNYKKDIYNSLWYLINVNSYIDDMGIYTKRQDMLKVWPFYTLDTLPLDEEEKKNFDEASPNSILWRFEPAVHNTEKPGIYAYYKHYSNSYKEFLAYVEIKINSDFLTEYINLLGSNGRDGANLYLMKEGNLLYQYTDFEFSDKKAEVILSKDADFGLYGSYYYFKFTEPNYGITVLSVFTDKFSTRYSFVMMFGILLLIICLITMSLLFFREISELSGRIGDFSDYMEKSGSLQPYRENFSERNRQPDEFAQLVDSFNSMLERNSLLNERILGLELRNRDAKLAAMQAQINPHFIYGTLETIRMLAVQNDDADVETIVCSFSKFMRYSLNNPSGKSTVSTEVEINRYYMDIQLWRFDGRLHFECRVEEDLPEINCPPFIVQPLLENALVHGVAKSLNKCTVKLRVFRENGDYVIRIEDDGMQPSEERMKTVNKVLSSEMDPTSIRSHNSGFGLSNVAERLRLFYRDEAILRLLCEDNWTISQIRISEAGWRGQVC